MGTDVDGCNASVSLNDVACLESLLFQSKVSPLFPVPSICSLLRCPAIQSDVTLCRSLFKPESRPLKESEAWQHAGEKLPVCALCFEVIGEGVLQDEMFNDDSFFVSYKLHVSTRAIEVKGIKVACSSCRHVRSLERLLPLCSQTLAAQSALEAPVPLTTSIPLAYKSPELTETTDTLVGHFFGVNDLDPVKEAHTFQATISLAFSLLVLARQHSWKLYTSKPTFASLFSSTE